MLSSQSLKRFMRHLGWSCFPGIQSVCSVYGALELDPCGVYSVSLVYGALGLNVSCGMYCVFVVNGVLGMGAC